MENRYTLHVSAFNDKVRVMNQLRQNELRLTAVEANNLLADVTAILVQVAKLTQDTSASQNEITEITMDGGGFK
jgi:hypothetical protein